MSAEASSEPARSGVGNGHLGVIDVGDASAALLSARLRRRGHLVTRLVLGDPPAHSRSVTNDERVNPWVGGAQLRDLAAVIATGNRRCSNLCRDDAAAIPLLAATAHVDLSDELALLTWLGDHDIDVPRMLGASTEPSDLHDALPTDGPVVLAHSRGEAVFVRRRCANQQQLTQALRTAAANPSVAHDHPGSWYLTADLGGGDAVVAGVFRAGEPVVWGARAMVRDRFGRPIRTGPASAPGRLFELVEDAAGQLAIDGPAEFQLVVSGSEVALVGLAPTVTWAMLELGTAADDAIADALAMMGVPCAARPPTSPDTAPATGWRPVPPHRAWAGSSRLGRTASALLDPWRMTSDVPSAYRRWAITAGRRPDPLVSASERTASPRRDR